MSSKNVGFIGMGRMGLRMALRLVHEYSVFGTDKLLTMKAVTENSGISWMNDPASMASICRYIFLVVGTEDDLREVIFGQKGLLKGIESPVTIVLSSTVRPSYVRALAERLSSNTSIQLLDCPIARGEKAAESGDLLLLVGGNRTCLDEVKPILGHLGSDIEFLGPHGAGQVAKAVNNYLLWTCLTASVEGLDFGERLGVDREKLRSVLVKSSGANWALSSRADDRAAFWAENDMASFLAEADRYRFAAPIAGQVREAIKSFKQDRHLERSPDFADFTFPKEDFP